MASTRVKESCLPCRRRKTRCDDAQPCSSCVLRKTQAECRVAGATTASETAQLDARDAESRRRGNSAVARDEPALAPGRAYTGGGGSRGPGEQVLDGWSGAEDGAIANGAGNKRRRLSPDRAERGVRAYAPLAAGSGSGNGIGSAPTIGLGIDEGVTTVQTGQALDELARLRSSIAALERHCLEMDKTAQAAATAVALENARRMALLEGGGGEGAEVSPEDRERWETLWAVLPDLGSCEILLEYLVQECDFLYPSGNIVELWVTAVRRRGVSAVQASKLAIGFATAALLLGHGSHPFYRPRCNPVQLNVTLWELCQSFANSPPTTFEEVEVAVDYTRFLVYSGRHIPLQLSGPGACLPTAIQIGLLDESHPSWYGLSEDEREWKRQVATDLVMNTRWSSLMLPKDVLADVRINVCLPTFKQIPLDMPIRSMPKGSSWPMCYANEREPEFRLFRVKSTAERQRTTTYRHTMMSIAEILPRMKALHNQLMVADTSSDPQVEALAIRAANINDELKDWYQRKLPQAGWPIPTADDVSPTDMARCKRASQALSLHNAITFLQAGVLRPWLTAGIQGQRHDSVRKQLHDDCLRNADRIMEALPVIRALLATRTQPIITPWSACVCFIAAMSYAVPLLRAVQKLMAQPAGAAEEDIRQLPALPDGHVEWRTATLGGRAAGAHLEDEKPIPAYLFGDNEIRTCANNILKVLDVLSILRVSPLGASAETKVRSLIRKYNLASPEQSPGDMREGSMAYELPGASLMPPAAGLPITDGLGGLAADFSRHSTDPRHQDSIDQGASALLQLANNGSSNLSYPTQTPTSGGSYSNGIMQTPPGTASSSTSAARQQPPDSVQSKPNPVADFSSGTMTFDFDTFFPPSMDPAEAYFGFQPGLAAGTTANPVVLEQLFQMDSRLWENWLDPLPTPAIPPPQL